MKLTIRLDGAIWLSVLIVIGGFAFLQIREERERLVDDLKRRAVLVGEGLKEAIEPQVARDSTAGVERILKKFGTARRGVAGYDPFAGLVGGAPRRGPAQTSSARWRGRWRGSRGACSGPGRRRSRRPRCAWWASPSGRRSASSSSSTSASRAGRSSSCPTASR